MHFKRLYFNFMSNSVFFGILSLIIRSEECLDFPAAVNITIPAFFFLLVCVCVRAPRSVTTSHPLILFLKLNTDFKPQFTLS